MKPDLINNALAYLFATERFYAEVLLQMKRIYTKNPRHCPTIGVGLTTEGVHLVINEYFIQQFDILSLAGILAHEAEHIKRLHIERMAKFMIDTPEKDPKQSIINSIKNRLQASIINQAQDYAINQNLKKFPKTFKMFDENGKVITWEEKGIEVQDAKTCLLEYLRADYPQTTIEANQAWEYYYGVLLRNMKPGQSEYYSIDDHSILEESLKQLPIDLQDVIVKNMLNQAYEACAGNVSSDVKILIEKINNTVDWRIETRRFLTSQMNVNKESTRKKRNRRYGLDYPGYRTNDFTHIMVAIDSSGSTSQYWNLFFAEMKAMKLPNLKVTVVECDSKIKNIQTLTDDIKLELKGGGGTSFKPVFDLIKDETFIQEHGKVDGLIYLTDGEEDGNLEEPDIKVLWALTPGRKSNYDWGDKIYLKEIK